MEDPYWLHHSVDFICLRFRLPGLFRTRFPSHLAAARPFSGTGSGSSRIPPFFFVFRTQRRWSWVFVYEMRQRAFHRETQLVWWLRSVVVMLGGLFIVTLIEYIPYFMGIGPGMDLLFTSLFGGPFISFLIVLIPQFILFFFISTYAYRKTGYIYVGSVMLTILGAWAITGGSSFM